MDLYSSLYGIAKLLLSQDDDRGTAELILRRILELTGAERGFIVVRAGDSFERAFDVGFEGREQPADERRFSRSLVRQAIETRQPIYSPSLAEDSRFGEMESIKALGSRSVLVMPLCAADEVFGAVHLERSADGFSDGALSLLREFTEVAALFLLRATERESLRRRSRALERDLFAQYDFSGIVTRDARMLALLKMVGQVAETTAPVLVRGETGTGKELVARAIHVNSARREKPYVALHCSALPGSLLESELFGHVRGAFTGADRERAGRASTAHGGTLFLDEVAEIAPEIQAKLLRFIQFGELQRVGSDRVEKVDVRIVAATHQNIPALIQAGRFRQDLYYRLKVVELEVPPLRERAGDVPLLIDHFLQRHWRRAGERPSVSARAKRSLQRYAWPGNVRELSHAIERACVLATGPQIDTDVLPLEIVPSPRSNDESPVFQSYTNEELHQARQGAVAAVERAFVAELMRRCENNVSRAAREAGMPRSYLQKLLGRHR